MSSDFLEDVKDEIGNTVQLTMIVGGFARLIIFETDLKNEIDEIINDGVIADFHLVPNELGWNNAIKIANALTDWVEHTKRIKKEENAS